MYYLLIALAIILSGPIAPFVIIIKSLIKRFKWKKLIKSYNERYWLNETEKNEKLKEQSDRYYVPMSNKK